MIRVTVKTDHLPPMANLAADLRHSQIQAGPGGEGVRDRL